MNKQYRIPGRQKSLHQFRQVLTRLTGRTLSAILVASVLSGQIPSSAEPEGIYTPADGKQVAAIGLPLPNAAYFYQVTAHPRPKAPTTPPPQTSVKRPPSTPLLKGQVTYVVPRGTGIKLKLASVPTSGLKLMDRDLDGKLYPAKLNQVITAKTTEDLFIGDNKVLPEGTVFYGKVTDIKAPRRLGRPGSLVLTFDHFKVPDGRRFAFKVEADNARASTLKTKAKGFGIIMAHAAGGAVVGMLVAYQIFGLSQTMAMHGYNIAGGAAGGALMGTAVGIMRRGQEAVLEPGDDLNMEIDSDLFLPAASAPTPKSKPTLAGLEVKVLKSKVIKDGLEGHMLRLDTVITNETARRLKSIDLYLEDDNGSQLPVCTGMDEDSELLFTIEPHSIQRLRFNFQLEYPKLKRKLVWLDHATQREIYRQDLP